MAIARKTDFQVQDFTTEINLIPRKWNLFSEGGMFAGMFTETRNYTDNISIDVIQEKTDTYGDTRRGGTRNALGNESATEVPLKIPLFTLDDSLTARDIQNVREYGTAQDVMTENSARMRIMERIRRYHGALMEKIMVNAIMGGGFSPNGTTTEYNYYTVFSRTQQTVDFEFSTATTDINEQLETAYAHIVDNAQNMDGAYRIKVLCSPGWFSEFIKHPNVAGAYEDYMCRVNPNRERTGGDSIYRTFSHFNFDFVEYRGRFGTTDLVTANQAFMFPMGIDSMFEMHMAPGDLLDAVNEPAQDLYMIERRDHRRLIIESDSAMLGLNNRPELVVQLTMS